MSLNKCIMIREKTIGIGNDWQKVKLQRTVDSLQNIVNQYERQVCQYENLKYFEITINNYVDEMMQLSYQLGTQDAFIGKSKFHIDIKNGKFILEERFYPTSLNFFTKEDREWFDREWRWMFGDSDWKSLLKSE